MSCGVLGLSSILLVEADSFKCINAHAFAELSTHISLMILPVVVAVRWRIMHLRDFSLW